MGTVSGTGRAVPGGGSAPTDADKMSTHTITRTSDGLTRPIMMYPFLETGAMATGSLKSKGAIANLLAVESRH